MSQTVIGLDVGHSAVKASVLSGGKVSRFFIPSVVCPAIAISDEAEAKRAEAETVSISSGAGGRYFFGETALTQGAGSVTGLSENWISTKEHAALLVGAYNKIKSSTGFVDKPDLVMGLPTSLVSTQRDELEALVSKYLPEIGSLKIIPQAMGPLYGIMFDENGMPSPEHLPTESWGVVEVGYYTSDFMMTKKGRWAQSASDVCAGVRVAADHIKRIMGEKNITVSFSEAEEIIQTKEVKIFGKRHDASAEVSQAIAMVASEVVDTANRLMEAYVRQLDGVLVAGGGAPLVFEQLKDQWPHAIMVDEHRFAVAEGMRRLGVARSIRRQNSES